MKYKAGDKVRVRLDLKSGIKYYMEDGVGWNDFPEKKLQYAGHVVTISSYRSGPGGKDSLQYRIEEDGGAYGWTDGMFEGFAEDWMELF